MAEAFENCGDAGAFFYDGYTASKVVYNLILQLYHRGHEGAGIASHDGHGIRLHKRVGRARDIFSDALLTEELPGNVAIGHTRYGTVGLDRPELFLHPLRAPDGSFYIAHNGTIAPYELEELLREFPDGSAFDTRVLAALLQRNLFETNGDWVETLSRSSERLDGSYTCTLLTSDGKLIAFREPRGFKPLNYGELPEGYVVASETSALKAVGARNVKPVRSGEMIIIDESGLRKEQFAESKPTPCSFEPVYFSRYSSVFDGLSCSDVRIGLGRRLAEQYPVDVNFVGPVPDSGRAAAVGFSHESGIPLHEVLEINREVGRVFILPPWMRDAAMKQKYLPIESVVEGKSLVLTDDSIVRGETTRSVIGILRDAGAKEVHVRITFPPISFPCLHGGVAFASRSELAINKFGGKEGVRKYINADSLEYTTVDDLELVGIRNACHACVDGKYPLNHVPDFDTALRLGLVSG